MLKTTKSMKLPTFNEEQIDMQVKKICSFLELIHPFLKEADWQEGCIELRPLKRMKNLGFVKSFNSWKLVESDKERLKEFFKRLNGKGYCVYYSVFTFDYHKEVRGSNGKKKMSGMINNENALTTQILVMDFDDISQKEFEIEKRKLKDLGIETIDIFSGHGYQSIILLKEKVADKQILKKFTKLLIQKGFKVDEAIVDAARVMRLPFTFNCKSLDKNNKYYKEAAEEVIPVGVADITEERYHVQEIFEKINSLVDVIPINEQQQINFFEEPTEPTTEEIKQTKTAERVGVETLVQHKIEFADVESGKRLYPMLSFENLPLAIQKMLLGAEQGFRNNTRYFLVNFFAAMLGYSKVQITEIMVIWGSQCRPALHESNIKPEIDRMYNYKHLPFNSDVMSKLTKVYGYIEIAAFKKESNIIIPNLLFENYAELPEAAVKIYFTLKLSHSKQKQENYKLEEIMSISGLSRSTVINNIKELVRNQLLSKKKTNNRLGEKDIYYLTPYFEKAKGFTLIPLTLANILKDRATNSELKAYLLMRKMVGPLGGRCFASQKELAKKLGNKQSALSKLTTRMHEKGLIEKVTEKYQNVPHTSYTLLNEISLPSKNKEVLENRDLTTAS